MFPWHPRRAVSIASVADMLDVSYFTVWRMIRAGEIEAYQPHPQFRYRVLYESVEEFAERLREKTPNERA
jgi:excisionase family DNA binding protein